MALTPDFDTYPTEVTLTDVALFPGWIETTWSDGRVTRFHHIWLRDNCPCAECRDPRNGQKLFGITDLDADLTVTDVTGTTVTFSDGHVSRFDPSFLATAQEPDDRCEDAKELWATT